MSKQIIQQHIAEAEEKVKETHVGAGQSRGVLNDMIAIIAPMQLDQLQILREIADALPD